MSTDAPLLDKHEVRRSFDRAAAGYDAHARVQREVGARLLERVAEIRLTPQVVLDVGSGTGDCTEALARRFRRARTIGLDISTAMVRTARAKRRLRLYPAPRYLVADMEALPQAPQSVDLLFSNLCFQWAGDLATLFAELYRVGSPGAPLVFSTFGPDTLRELRQAWRVSDDGVHVNAFADMHDLGDLLMAAGFTDVVMDVDRLTDYQPDVYAVMRGLKAIGAHNANAARSRGLTGRRHLEGMREAYEALREEQGLPVSYEVVYGLGWIPQPAGVLVAMPRTGTR